MHYLSRSLVPIALALSLSACGGGEGASPGGPSGGVVVVPPPAPAPAPAPSPAPVPSPTPAPTPTPSPTPTPAPTPTPTPSPSPPPIGTLDDGVTVLLAEGDSITSPKSVVYYASAFAAARSTITFHNKAVAGSVLKNLIDRRDGDLALKPDVLTVFVGANDFGPDAVTYAQRVFDYVAPFRALGTKVYIATVLPRNIAQDNMVPAVRNAERRKYAQLMQDAVGKRIDGVIDFGRAPIIGDDGAPFNTQIYGDGLHPTGIGYNGGIGGHDYLLDAYRKIIDPVLQALRK